MTPTRPGPSAPRTGRKPSSGRPVIFGSSARNSGRIEKRTKRTIPANESAKRSKQEKGLGLASTEADTEGNTRLALVRPQPEPAMNQSSPKRNGRDSRGGQQIFSMGVPQDTNLATSNGTSVGDQEAESRQSAVSHNSSQGGTELKGIADLLLASDGRQNFRIPSNKIIASKDVDRRVYQQMRRLAPGGKLTPDNVRKNLIDSIHDMKLRWNRRTKKSRSFFWNRVCKNRSTSWMNQLDGADCREFFLWLVVYFRHGSGNKTPNKLNKGFEELVELFEGEEDCELDELVGIEARVQLPAEQPAGHDRVVVSKKRDSMSTPVNGNIFRLSGNTNMTDDELRGIDIQGLTPIVDVGGSRRKHEDRKKAFDEELKADEARIAEEKAEQAAREQATATEAAVAPGPQPTTTRSRKRGSRKH